jgi:hypothetical protein
MTHESSDCLRHFAHTDFDLVRAAETPPTRCPVKGCTAKLVDVWYGDQKDGERTLPWCPEHGLRLHSKTFVYWNGPGRLDDARLRSFVVSRDLARAVALGKGKKAESHRLGYEMSEDALSWNVFQSLAVAGKLRDAAHYLTGRPLHAEPRLYLWGHRIDDPDGEHRLHEPLRRVRGELEPDIHTFVTEPDIMLVAEGEMVICIEAKFGSGNPLAHDSKPKDGEKPTSRAGLLARYLGDRTSERTKRIVQADRTGPAPRSQLLRNIVFASEMAGDTPWHVVNLVSSTQGAGVDDRYKSYADPTSEVTGYLHPDWHHCFTFRTWEGLHAAAVAGNPELASLDTYLRGKSAHYRRAFELGESLG